MDATAAQNATWVVVGLATVTMLKNVADGILAWLMKRDQLKADTKVKELEIDVRESKKIADSAVFATNQIKAELETCHTNHAKSEQVCSELRATCNRQQSEIDDLKRKVGSISTEQKGHQAQWDHDHPTK